MPWHCLPNSNFKVCELVLPWVTAVDTNGSCGWAASFCKEQRCSSTAVSAVSSARAQLSGAFSVAVSSEQRRTPEQRTKSVEQRAPMGKLLRLLWFHLVSVIFLQRVLQNKGDKSICPVLSTRICQKSYFETTALHNVYILEYLFIRTEQNGTNICWMV